MLLCVLNFVWAVILGCWIIFEIIIIEVEITATCVLVELVHAEATTTGSLGRS